MKVKLTPTRVREAKQAERTRIIWDTTVTGLGLRITPAGSKAFIMDYYIDGQRRRMTLGAASEKKGGLSLDDAHLRAANLRQAAKDGHDPMVEAKARRELPTVSDALDRFVAEYIPNRQAKGRMTERTEREYRRQIERDLRPTLGKKRVKDVVQEDIEKALKPLAPVSANRVRALASKVFRCCEDWGWRAQYSNPARGIEKALEEARDRTLSADELGALGRALSTISANPGAVLAIRLAAVTGLRIGEVSAIRWADVDLKSRVLTLPRTKTGRRVHTLPSVACALLADTERKGECVIPGRDPDKPLNDRAVRRAFDLACEEAGIAGTRLHDLRRTVMTQAAAMGVNAHLLRDMVGHKTTAMADRYIRSAGEPLTELRERIGSGMAARMEGGEAEVTEHPAKRSKSDG